MSELDYSRSTGRAFGQAGSLRTDQMSSMQRGNAINREVADQKRETAFERRLMRQLGRASRKGDIEAGLLGRELTLDAQARGAKVQGGIGSSEENRSVAAQSIFDRNRLTNQQDAATDGMPEQTTQRASIRPSAQAGPMPSPMPTGGTSTLDGGAQPMPYDEAPPTPSPTASGGQISALDRELLQYGARVNADLRNSPGFGSRPGMGLVSSRRMESAASPAPQNAARTYPNAPPQWQQRTRARLGISSPSPSAEAPSRLDTPSPSTFSVSPEVQAKRAAEDAEYETRRASMAEQRQRDLDEGAGRNAELKASRVTENWQGSRLDSPIGFNMGSTSEMVRSPRGRMIEKTTDNPTSTLTYAERDKNGNQYRPKGWTQEDEEASAKASERGAKLDQFISKYPGVDIMTGDTLSRMRAKSMTQMLRREPSTAAPVQIAKPKKRRN